MNDDIHLSSFILGNLHKISSKIEMKLKQTMEKSYIL